MSDARGPAAEGTATKHVMIAEDDQQLRGVIRMLVEEDTRLSVVHEVSTGGQAVAYALAHPIDLAIIDHHLVDGASGVETAETIRKARPDVRIVVCSADVEVNELAPAGAVDALVSKQQLIHLLHIVQELLHLPT